MAQIKSRTTSFIIVILAYVSAFGVACLIFFISKNLHLLISTLLADIAATLIIWGFGLIFKNSSIYDPYWSVAPPVIVTFWLLIDGTFISAIDILIIIAITIWSIRLTLNWALRWNGLSHQDWRYTMLRKRSPGMWFFTNLVGINLMPTIIVFLALIPLYFITTTEVDLSFLSVLGFIVCLGSILIEFIADRQMDLFKKEKSSEDQYINTGLWKFCRHPNYLGEVSFWWGIWIMQVGTVSGIWITIAGPVIMTGLFVFISIPMMERHLKESRKTYKDYQKQVSMIIPWFKRVR